MTYAGTAAESSPQTTPETRNWATLSHLSAFVVFLGIPSLVGPLVAWLLKRDDPYVDHHAREALNFNISFLIYGLVAALSILLLIGLLLLPIVAITWFVLVIRGAVKASNGEYYVYPFTMRLVN
jgi:uncharacterized Tic20 family protein